MKERATVSMQKTEWKGSELLAAAGQHFLFVLAGIAATRATVSGGLIPFGLSLAAGAPAVFFPAASIGVFLGYFFIAVTGGGFHRIAALLAIVSIRVLLGGFPKTAKKAPFLCLICFLASFFTSAVAYRTAPGGILTVLTESLLSLIGTYFLIRCFKTVRYAASGMETEELCFLFFGLSLIVTAFCDAKISGISFGHILGFLLLFIAAKYGGIVSGAICGIVLSFTLLLHGEAPQLTVLFALSGLFAGLFSPFSKYLQILPTVLLGALALLPNGTAAAAAGVVELLSGAALFLLLPRQAGIAASRFLSPFPKMATFSGIKKTVSMRLDVASEALRDIAETVEQVAGELSRINTPDFKTVLTRIEQEACAGCKLRPHCWEKRKQETVNALLKITGAVKTGSDAPEEDAPPEFAGQCLRLTQVANAAKRHYSDYVSRIAAESRIEEVRSVISDQFDGISMMLAELAKDVADSLKFDNALAEKATAALQALGIRAEECNCRTDRFGRTSIELKIKKEPETVLNKLQIMKMASVACERDFGVPTVTEAGENLFLTLTEYPAIRVDVGVEQKCASPSGMCGDAYRYFPDGRGHFILILSDGMGTGGRAAVDGAMTSGLMGRLIKAGFGYDCSLKILNSAMLFKSTDESLATVDIVSVDLFTGKTELYKAGAAPTFIRRSGRAGKAESASLPAGILRDIRFDTATVRCKTEDIIVLISDGAMTDGTEWIKKELEDWQSGSAQALAEKLCESAFRRRQDDRLDDITVIAAILKKSL